jgi:hypothetical protein
MRRSHYKTEPISAEQDCDDEDFDDEGIYEVTVLDYDVDCDDVVIGVEGMLNDADV